MSRKVSSLVKLPRLDSKDSEQMYNFIKNQNRENRENEGSADPSIIDELKYKC
jgi:hypothetical protein